MIISVLAVDERPQFNGKIEYEPGSSIDLFEYISNGENQISENLKDIKEKAIMIVGPSGSGKSTLINYLIGVPLISIEDEFDNWVILVDKNNTTSITKFDIGHDPFNSKTSIPDIYSPYGESFCYVDNPGLFDNRGITIDIANRAFMKNVATNFKKVKFLLLIQIDDVRNKRDIFGDSIKEISNFLDISKKNNSKTEVGKSIGIIITKIDNQKKSDDIVKSNLIQFLIKKINASRTLSNFEKSIFENIIRYQTEIFSNPKQTGPLNKDQKIRIERLIHDRLKYIDKDSINFKVKISENSESALRKYIDNQTKYFENHLENELIRSLTQYLNVKKESDLVNLANKYEKLGILLKIGSKKSKFETFIQNFDDSILSEKEKNSLKVKKNRLDSFVELIPDNYTIDLIFEKQWISVDIISMLENFNKKIIKRVHNEYKNFNDYVNEEIDKALAEYFPKRVRNFKHMKNVEKFEAELNSLIKVGIENKMNVSEIFNETPLVSPDQNNAIHKQYEILNYIFLKLTKDELLTITNNTEWIGKKLILKIKDLTGELKQYYVEKEPVYNKCDGTLTFENHFVNISSIIRKINHRDDINNLKRVQIYSTHSVTFDRNYSISKDKYIGNAPDLVIISPQVIANIKITINLSCETVPGYPDGRSQAKSGTKSGENGEDGLPGLPGFNGGNLIIISEKISDLDNLEFISKGIF